MPHSKMVSPLTVLFALLMALPGRAFAHCDGMDGPVVKAAIQALATGNVNLVLIWVQRTDETQIRRAFLKTLAVRKLSPEARELADLHFFETLVRIHRAGEGEPYTGLKPAGRDLGPAIPAADKAVEDGSVEPLVKLLVEAARTGVRERFQQVVARKDFAKDDVNAGREYVKAYFEFVHYAESLHQAARRGGHEHSHESESAGDHGTR